MIDRETVNRILDAADIVDVVSDFVSLRRRGVNYVGLCPFHNEKTPSFSVSPSRQICHCFSCGKGGSPVGFIMEHEQMSYPEALRYLAKKYGIEVHESETTDEERAAQNDRESMLVLNEYASRFFEKQLHDTTDGQEIGLAYFRERGFTDETIRKFHLGYSPDRRTALYDTATGDGYNRKYLIDTGLCIDDQKGGGFDRFRGRVMFPVFNTAGKVIAFGGRTLKGDKAKYLNSPESTIYVKNRELYGIFHAKRAIVKEDCCYLVEGYTDVISMHQAGIENVVASSGTSLTEGQIKMIQRFTANVTVLYDGDAAGIHASLRGIDMLLAQGINVRVLLLPDGEDPDSFARKHSASQFKEYIDNNQDDFISFKTKTLLQGTNNDPIKLSAMIGDVVGSIAVIPNPITRELYLKQCSSRLGIDITTLTMEMEKKRRANKKEDDKRRERELNKAKRNAEEKAHSEATADNGPTQQKPSAGKATTPQLEMAERDLARYIAKFGMCFMCNTEWDDGSETPTTVVEYIAQELEADEISFETDIYNKIFNYATAQVEDFYKALDNEEKKREQDDNATFEHDVKSIDVRGQNAEGIQKKERELMEAIRQQSQKKIDAFRAAYLEKLLCSMGDAQVMNMAHSLVIDKHRLSKIFAEGSSMQSEQERLVSLVVESLYNLKAAIIDRQRQEVMAELKNANGAPQQVNNLQSKLIELDQLRKKLAKLTGERVVKPISHIK